MKSWMSSLAVAALLPLGSVALAQQPPEGGTPEADTPKPPEEGAEGTRERERQRDERRDDRRFRRGMGRMGLPVDRLKEQLGLTDEQAKQLEAINAEIQTKMQEFRKQMQEGNLDVSKMREMFQNGRQEMEAKLKEVLSPEQFQKLQEFQQRMRERGGGRGRGRDREELSQRLRSEALKALALTEEEAAVVTPRLDAVFETRKLMAEERERRREEFLKQVRETSDSEALVKLLEEYRAAQQADREQLQQAQDQLREVLTVFQEAKLVGLNVLE